MQNHVVLVLARTVVSVKLQFHLTESKVSKKVVKQADHSVRSLAGVQRLIDEVVDLSWNALTADAKDGTLACCLEVHWTRLEEIVGVMDLLGEIDTREGAAGK